MVRIFSHYDENFFLSLIHISRSPQAEVLALVVQDMKDAMAIDSKIVDGRANSWAAKAFLGKVYYTTSKSVPL